MEQQAVTGIAFSRDEAQISIRQVQDKPGVAAAIFGPLAEASINVDMIVQNVSADGKTTDLTFTVPAADYQRSLDTIAKAKDAIGYHAARRRYRCRQDFGDRYRHAQPCRRCRPGVQRARRARHQYPRHHHLGDQVFAADRRRIHRACGAHAAFALWARQGVPEFRSVQCSKGRAASAAVFRFGIRLRSKSPECGPSVATHNKRCASS